MPDSTRPDLAVVGTDDLTYAHARTIVRSATRATRRACDAAAVVCDLGDHRVPFSSLPALVACGAALAGDQAVTLVGILLAAGAAFTRCRPITVLAVAGVAFWLAATHPALLGWGGGVGFVALAVIEGRRALDRIAARELLTEAAERPWFAEWAADYPELRTGA